MRFEGEHRFAAPPPAVVDVLADPAFYQDLTLPDLRLDDVVDHHRDETGAVVRLRYEYTGNLDPMALRLLGGERLTWLQELAIEPSGTSGTLTFRTEANPDVLHGDASFTLDADGGTTVRRLSGDVVVTLPIIGAMAERRIVPGVVARLDIEAEAINRRLAGS